MKLLLDQNLSPTLISELPGEFEGSLHVRPIGLARADDDKIWAFAKHGGFTIVSKDTDFQQRALLYGPPPKVIWLRLGNCSTQAISELLKLRAVEIVSFIDDPTASFLALA